MSDKQLQWVQLHVSALGVGHHQVVLRLFEQLYNKRGILGGVGVVGGRDFIPHNPHSPRIPCLFYSCSKNLRTTWWWPIPKAETCSCTQCSCLSLTDNIDVLWLTESIIHKIYCLLCYYVRWYSREEWLLASLCSSVPLSFGNYQRSSLWTDFTEICYSEIL